MHCFKDQPSDLAIEFSISEHGPGFKLSPYFKLIEAASKDGDDTVIVHPSLLVLLNTVRKEHGRVIVNSWYRSRTHNARIGGKPNSYHMKGMAADIVVPSLSLDDLYVYVNNLHVGGIGRYNSFVHVDVGPVRRWDERSN